MTEEMLESINDAMRESQPDIVEKYNEKLKRLSALKDEYDDNVRKVEEEFKKITLLYSIMESVRDSIINKLSAE